MLIRATVENFKSFDSRAEFSMIASKKVEDSEKYEGHCTDVGGMKLLKTTAVYGANAAGKSNLISFFSFLGYALGHFDPDIKRPLMSGDYCRNRSANKTRESYFEIQFTVGESLYAYGFTVILSRGCVTGEWLYELFGDGGVRPIMERNGGDAPVLGEGVLPGADSPDARRFEIYSKDFDGNDSKLFLADMNSDKTYGQDSALFVFKKVYDWITENVIVITPSEGITSDDIFSDEKYIEKLSDMLRSFDTGISSVKRVRLTEEKAGELTSPDFVEDMFRRTSESHGRGRKVIYGGKLFIYSLGNNDERKISKLLMKHKGSDFEFEYSDESDGTKRLLDLIDILITDRPDTVYVVDELDRSFHPKLTERFLRQFIEIHRDMRAQLIISTHENTIMSKRVFRRDEIWFVEKNEDNVSEMYSLDKFKKIHNDERSVDYLDGRYGAVPMLNSSYETEDRT